MKTKANVKTIRITINKANTSDNHSKHQRLSKMKVKLLSILLIICSSLFADNVNQLLTYAKKGDAQAQFNLGVCYCDGEGVAVNKAEAVKWYQRAAEQGHEEAIKELKRLKAQTTIKKRFCTECGTKVEPGDKFCSNCGKKL